MKQSARGGERLRNRLLLLMAAAVALLTVIILLTGQGEPPVNSQGEPETQPVPPPQSNTQSDSQPTSGNDLSSESMASSESTAPSESTASSESAAPSPSPAPSQPASADLYYEEALPLLVNPTNKLPEGYKADVEVIGNGCSYSYDRRAVVAYRDMAAAAKADGVTLTPVSAYRSNEKQTTNFNNKIKEFENLGYTAQQAYAATAQLIAVPGTSEHELGLAIDLNSLETSFENTKTFTWLIEHCADYGFILRYPKDKTEITDISYEPWHYRYVGSNHARPIMEQGICLEEYLTK